MQIIPQILVRHLNYVVEDKTIFTDLSLTFNYEKIGIIGKNGVGKTTLLKILCNGISPSSGIVEIYGSLAYCPQIVEYQAEASIAEALDISQKLQALERIRQGSIAEEDYIMVNDDWTIAQRVQQQLESFGLADLNIDRKVSTLSGGERTRLHLAKAFLANPDFIILDEPTNNLDIQARELLYQAISAWHKGLMVVSHDRTLLNLMDNIVELTTLGANQYGGNYAFYLNQKQLITEANQRDLSDARKYLSQVKSSVQLTKEKSQQKKSYGRKQFLSGKVDRLTANSKRGRSERTQSRNAKQSEMMIEQAQNKLKEAQTKIEILEKIDINLAKTEVPNGKMVIDIEDLTFRYPHQTEPIINHFNLKISGPARIAICGKNGSGKSTLIKLILNELTPTHGKISMGVSQFSYLDQNVSLLNSELSVLGNFKIHNPDVNDTEAYHNLAQFLFRNTAAQKQVKQLSGGEKLRAGLACTLMASKPPQLLILDEPTNHLDIESLTNIEAALCQYQGALLVISHDTYFLENIDIEEVIESCLFTRQSKF